MKLYLVVLICLYAAMAIVAIALSVTSVTWCDFIEFELPGGATPSLGAWRYRGGSWVDDPNAAWGSRWVESCDSYPDSWDMDTKWMSSRVFSILAPLLGTVASLCLCLSAKLAAGLFMLTALFQGLTLLMLKSDFCNVDTNPFFANLNSTSVSSISDCKLGRSGMVSSVATAFFFLSALSALWYDVAKSKKDAEEDGGAALDTKEAKDEGAAVAVGEGDRAADMPEETVAA